MPDRLTRSASSPRPGPCVPGRALPTRASAARRARSFTLRATWGARRGKRHALCDRTQGEGRTLMNRRIAGGLAALVVTFSLGTARAQDPSPYKKISLEISNPLLNFDNKVTITGTDAVLQESTVKPA